jgi:hypothetical protein
MKNKPIKKETKQEKIKRLRKEINYEKRKMKCCAYSKRDIYYVIRLEEELQELIHGGNNDE